MEDIIYVFGHKNPDSDSICSAICYAELKNLLGLKNAQAFRLGELTKETKFILNYFDFPEPELLKDVMPQIKDLRFYRPLPISKEEPIKRVWEQLKIADGSKVVSIVDNEGYLEGLITAGDITEIYMESDVDVLNTYKIYFKNLLEVIQGTIIRGGYTSRAIEGGIYLSTTVPKDKSLTYKDVVIVNTLRDFTYFANTTECGVIIITDNQEPEIPENNYKCIVKVPYGYIKTISTLYQSVTVGSVMKKENIDLFVDDNYVSDAQDIMKTSAHRNFPVLDIQGKFIGIISRRHLLDVRRKKCILIDHNERGQSVSGLKDAQIIEIIDHHRVADVQTTDPLYIRSEPVGCTATIIYKAYCENKIFPRKEIAGLLLSAIISDTLNFSSPTCTQEDIITAKKLALIANIEIERYALEMLSAGAQTNDAPAEDLINMDRKEFAFGKYKVSITQMNVLSLTSISHRESEFVEAMEKLCEDKDYDLGLFMITDISLNGSKIIACGRKRDLVKKAFKMSESENVKFLPGVVSRKKQIVPKLISASQM